MSDVAKYDWPLAASGIKRVHSTTEWWLGEPLATPKVKGLCLSGACADESEYERGAAAATVHFSQSRLDGWSDDFELRKFEVVNAVLTTL
jgi:hypothetical protein